jgi:hypothetical protein
LPRGRIGLCWEATRAPARFCKRAAGRPPYRPASISFWRTKAINPGGWGAEPRSAIVTKLHSTKPDKLHATLFASSKLRFQGPFNSHFLGSANLTFNNLMRQNCVRKRSMMAIMLSSPASGRRQMRRSLKSTEGSGASRRHLESRKATLKLDLFTFRETTTSRRISLSVSLRSSLPACWSCA